MNIINEPNPPKKYRIEDGPSEALKHSADLAEVLKSLQDELTAERKMRVEERFVGIVFLVILFDVVFFTVMPSFGGPIALLILELLILIHLAQRMGMKEIAKMLDRVLWSFTPQAREGE